MGKKSTRWWQFQFELGGRQGRDEGEYSAGVRVPNDIGVVEIGVLDGGGMDSGVVHLLTLAIHTLAFDTLAIDTLALG